MPGKMARSAPRPPFWLPDALVTVLTSRLSCRKAGNTRISTPGRVGIARQIGSHLLGWTAPDGIKRARMRSL
jgi:hypothetical protein